MLLKLLKNQTIQITAGHKVNLRWGLTQYKSFECRSTTHPAQDLCSGVTLACVRKDCSNRAVHHIVSTHTHTHTRSQDQQDFSSHDSPPQTHTPHGPPQLTPITTLPVLQFDGALKLVPPSIGPRAPSSTTQMINSVYSNCQGHIPVVVSPYQSKEQERFN